MFKLEEFIGRRVLTSSLLEDEGLIAFFTTKDLPLKAGERADFIEEVENNKKLLCEELNIAQENLFIPQQTHSDNVMVVNGKWETVNGIFSRLTSHVSLYENTDALVTDQPGMALALNFADCVPILFYDPIKRVIAAAHAGWRGTVEKIGPKTVEKMVENFSCNPSDIIAAIGPAIGKCCFDVKEDVAEKLAESVDKTLSNKGFQPLASENSCIQKNEISNPISDNHADLKLINKLQLLAYGLEKIDVCEYCTFCQSELFFSYRREKGKTARHSAVIMVNGKQ
jgi:YfiH family protein